MTDPANHQLPVSAPVDTDSAGKGGPAALSAAVRVVCPSTGSGGTGFVHYSGRVITAEHVVRSADPTSIVIVTSTGAQIKSSNVQTDADLDLAIIELASDAGVQPLPLSKSTTLSIGTQVSTWGFPAGYMGIAPILTVGYLSGIEHVKAKSGATVRRWVVNAAFNGGNSGGPVLHLEDGSVIGVVSSKLAPLPDYIQSALVALSEQVSGFSYTAMLTDGTSKSISEGQLISEVLQYLRSQTQLVLGHAVTLDDLCAFLARNGVAPHAV
jgi:S1-C subfamily serine protease